MNIRIGKARISISVEGCMRCGTQLSSGWYVIKEVPLRIGERNTKVELYVCNDCATAAEKTAIRQNDSGSSVQMRLGNLNKRGPW